MSIIIRYLDGFKEGVIQVGDYFKTEMPSDRQSIVKKSESGSYPTQELKIQKGATELWKLRKDLRLWGEPTKENLILAGKIGAEKGPNMLHRVASELFDLPEAFRTVASCALPKGHYRIWHKNIRELCNTYPLTAGEAGAYWIASSCTSLHLGTLDVWRSIFIAEQGRVKFNCLHELRDVRTHCYANPVCPVATVSPYLLLEIDGRDGSKERPWICLIK